jgi:hypothetical protein
MDEYEAQDDFDDTVVEYAASPDHAGCGCLGCATLLAMFLLIVLVAIIGLHTPSISNALQIVLLSTLFIIAAPAELWRYA